MHLTSSVSYLVAKGAAATTSTTTKAKGGSDDFLLVIIVLFGLFYFLMIRPNQRKRMQAMRQSRTFELGDEVVAGGMVGTVVNLADGEVDIEISDGVVVQFVPQAVQLRSAYIAAQARRGGGGLRGQVGGSVVGGSGAGGSGVGGHGRGATGAGGSRPDGPGEGGQSSGLSDAWPEDADTPSAGDGFGTTGDGFGTSGGASGTAGGPNVAGSGGTMPTDEDR